MKSSELSSEVWTKMRPMSDEGKTRGYSGPAELPLLLLAGGYKQSRGDITVDGHRIEIKGDGGRIGEMSKWCRKRAQIEKFINQYNTKAVHPNELQSEFNFTDEVVSQFANKFDYSYLPHTVSTFARQFNSAEMIKSREDAILFIGALQLLEYSCAKQDDWFVLFKHPGKVTVPVGTSFVLNIKGIQTTFDNLVKLYSSLKNCKVGFSPCYDTAGFKIKFIK